MKKIKLYSFIIFILFQFNYSNATISTKIVANVGNEIITSYELKNKIRIILLLSGQELSQNNVDKAKNLSMTSLINYKIKKQEVIKYQIKIQKDKNVERILNNLSKRFDTNQEGLINIFIKNNLDFNIYLEEIKTEIAWQKLVYRIYNNKINIDQINVDKEVEKILSNQKEIEEYELAEIEVEFDNELNKNNKIDVLKEEIKKLGFENAALKYSISASASENGKIGWVSSTSLSKKILKKVKNLNSGQVSEPIILSKSILFYKVLDIKKIGVNNVDREKLKNSIIEREKNELLNLYSNNYLSKLKNTMSISFK